MGITSFKLCVSQVTEELCKYVIESVLKQNPAEVAIYHNKIAESETKVYLNSFNIQFTVYTVVSSGMLLGKAI